MLKNKFLIVMFAVTSLHQVVFAMTDQQKAERIRGVIKSADISIQETTKQGFECPVTLLILEQFNGRMNQIDPAGFDVMLGRVAEKNKTHVIDFTNSKASLEFGYEYFKEAAKLLAEQLESSGK